MDNSTEGRFTASANWGVSTYSTQRYGADYRFATPVYSRPWYYEAPQVVVASSPYYFHAGLNLYLGGVNLNLAFTDPAPAGYVYVDPYCDRQFVTAADYRRHLHRHDHSPALWVEFVGY